MHRRSGFARFTNCRFSMKREDITNTFIHLTNVAIQKHAPSFDKDKGMKWPIRSLRLFLNTQHGAHYPGRNSECVQFFRLHFRDFLPMHTCMCCQWELQVGACEAGLCAAARVDRAHPLV
jgi:hypothetical protein